MGVCIFAARHVRFYRESRKKTALPMLQQVGDSNREDKLLSGHTGQNPRRDTKCSHVQAQQGCGQLSSFSAIKNLNQTVSCRPWTTWFLRQIWAFCIRTAGKTKLLLKSYCVAHLVAFCRLESHALLKRLPYMSEETQQIITAGAPLLCDQERT